MACGANPLLRGGARARLDSKSLLKAGCALVHIGCEDRVRAVKSTHGKGVPSEVVFDREVKPRKHAHVAEEHNGFFLCKAFQETAFRLSCARSCDHGYAYACSSSNIGEKVIVVAPSADEHDLLPRDLHPPIDESQACAKAEEHILRERMAVVVEDLCQRVGLAMVAL